MKRLYLAISFIIISFGLLSAQDMTEADKQALQKRVKDKVEEFQNYTSDIASKELLPKNRLAAIKSALTLFIGEGEPYTLTSETIDRRTGEPRETIARKKGVRMQLSSVNRDWISSKLTKDYLSALYQQSLRPGDVKIKSSDAVRVDNIHKVGEGRYEAMAYFCQEYIRYNDNGTVSYGDVTRKKVKVHIIAKEVPLVGTIFEVKLGDVYVVSTRRLW